MKERSGKKDLDYKPPKFNKWSCKYYSQVEETSTTSDQFCKN